MPLPTPNKGEKRSEFIDRCMVDLSIKKEFKDNKQRAAVCHSQLKKAAAKASVVDWNSWDDQDIFYYFSD